MEGIGKFGEDGLLIQWNKQLERRIIRFAAIWSLLMAAGYYLVQCNRDPDADDARALLQRYTEDPVTLVAANGTEISVPLNALNLSDAQCQRISSYGVPVTFGSDTRQPWYRCSGVFRRADGLTHQSTIIVRYLGYQTTIPTVRGYFKMPDFPK